MSNYSTQANLSTAITSLVIQALATLDTLKELATALGDDPNSATHTAILIGTTQAMLTATSPLSLSGNVLTVEASAYSNTAAINTLLASYLTKTLAA